MPRPLLPEYVVGRRRYWTKVQYTRPCLARKCQRPMLCICVSMSPRAGSAFRPLRAQAEAWGQNGAAERSFVDTILHGLEH